MDYTEVNTIRTQYQAGLWPQFLQMIQIEGLRGWSGQSVEFPVVAIVGENGSGKSTLMKVAACVYDNKDKDKRFFPGETIPRARSKLQQGSIRNLRCR